MICAIQGPLRRPNGFRRAAWPAERVPPARLPARGIAARALCLGALLALDGCGSDLLNPKGPIGAQEKHLIVLATAIMLAVVIPVIVMTLYFAWRYRASNAGATYAPTIAIVVAGSLWVMHNANVNMMPMPMPMSPERAMWHK